MDMLENILSQEIVHKLGWSLLHSLWQGVFVVLLLVVCLRVLRKSSANLRYVISCLGLAVIVLLPVVTFYIVPAPAPVSDVESVTSSPATVKEKLYKVYDADMPLQRAAEYMQISSAASWRQRAKKLYTSALPFVVVGWFIGVFALSLWHLGGWAHLQRLKRKKVKHVDVSLKDRLHNLTERLKVIRPVNLMESALVQIPTVVGWLRPVILLPASALTGLSREQLEALLAHELAHIRRYDYLVNIFQTLVEILGFYHPAVWWISYTIRVERENCCDDLAVSVCGDKVGYARALTSMEEARLSQGELAVAASGGSLSRRICRLIGNSSERSNHLGYAPVVISILLIVALMIPTTLALTAKHEKKDSNPVSVTKSDSIKTVYDDLAAKDQMNDSERYPGADLSKAATKAQILFDCEIYEVPADLKFIEDEQRKGKSGPIIMKLLESLKSEREKGSAGISIQLGKEYADSLKALSRENEYVKVLAAPKLMTLDGKEATVNTTQNVSYTADYEIDKGDDKPIPIIKNLPCEMELKVKGEVAKNNTIFTHLRLTQSKPVFATKQNDEGREIQIPIIERSDCTTYVDTRSGESIILGGLRSDEGPSRNLILVITPFIIRPEKGPEQAKIEKEIRAVAYDPEHIVVFPETEKGNVIAETRRPEHDKVMLEQQARDLEQKAAEFERLQEDIQRQLEDLEQRKTELESLSAVLALTKEAESGKEPRYHTVRESDSVDGFGVVLDDDRIEAEKAVIQAQIDALEAKLIERRKNYEAEIFNRESEWWAEMRAFTADVEVAKKSIFDANSVLERDLAALKKIEMEIKNFRMENGANIATDNALYNKLKTMTANRDAIKEQIKRDKAVLNRCEKEFKDAQLRREVYMQYRPMTGTDPNEAQRVINLAKKALELRLSELNKLSSEKTSPKEAKSEEEPRYHTVRPGETLSLISKKYYGSENKWQKILDCNREIITADGIRVGQRLVIPPLQASAKEPESEHERLAVMAAKCAERGDFAKAIENLEKAIELAKDEKDYGIGIAIEKVDGLIRISQLLPDAPASGSSFRQGDIIMAIDGVSTEGMSLNEVVARIRGPKGTKVNLTVKRHSQDIIVEEIFTRHLLLKGSPALQEYYWRLDAYEAGKTWPQYRKMMKYYKPWSGEAVQVYELKNADPEELAELLNRILQRRWKDVKDKPNDSVRFMPDPGHNKLIVLASPADIRLIGALIAELDVLAKRDTTVLKALPDTEYKKDQAAGSTITKVIKLKYADCKDVEQILRQILSDEHFKIATDKRTNMLIVAGTESAIEEVKALVAEIDVSVPEKNLEVGELEKQKGKDF